MRNKISLLFDRIKKHFLDFEASVNYSNAENIVKKFIKQHKRILKQERLCKILLQETKVVTSLTTHPSHSSPLHSQTIFIELNFTDIAALEKFFN